MELFPATPAMSVETVASKMSYFDEQIHLFHWQTRSYAEHKALGSIYDTIISLKDEIVEKLMGYNGGRRIKAFKIAPLVDYSSGAPLKIVQQVAEFAENLEAWAAKANYPDIENIAQSLSGEANKTIYLLTLT